MSEELIEVVVHGVVVDPATNSTIVLLVDVEKEKVLPIWIGAFEAFSISQVLENKRSPRPLTHDLIVNVLEESRTLMLQVVIYTIKDNTFYSYLLLELENRRAIRVDSRPSDAIAVALRTSSPIFISEEVYSVAVDYHGVLDYDKQGENPPELDSEGLKDWIKTIKPSDF